MKPWQERAVEEKRQLRLRLTALQAFLETPAFQDLSMREQDLLVEQEALMECYETILSDRIRLFEDDGRG